MRNITMADLAAMAGVSPAAVSLALRGSHKISKPMRERILQLANEHGYIYNRQAAFLRKQTSRTAAVCLHTITNPVFSTIFTAIERFFWSRGWTVLFGDSEDDVEKQSAFIARSIESNVAGLIVIPATGTGEEHLEAFAARVPIVLAAREIEGGGLDQVRIEYERGVTAAVDHLVSLRHRAIGWIGDASTTVTARRGFSAYRTALKNHGIAGHKNWENACLPDRRQGYLGMQRFLQAAPELTAVLCFSDLLAIGALRALLEEGLMPGKDMSLVGFDDLDEAQYAWPALSTVRIDLPLLGESAARLLLNRIEDRDTPRQEVSIASQLIPRHTTAEPNAANSRETAPAPSSPASPL